MVRKFEQLEKEIKKQVLEECNKSGISWSPMLEAMVIKSYIVDNKLNGNNTVYTEYMKYVQYKTKKMLSKFGKIDDLEYLKELTLFELTVAKSKLDVINNYKGE